MKIFTLKDGFVENFATVVEFTLTGANVKIPAIIIGESGRGRNLGILPVELTNDSKRVFDEKKSVNITSVSLGETKAGKPKLFEIDQDDYSQNQCLIVFRTPIGFRGGNEHTGDRENLFWKIDSYYISEELKSDERFNKTKYTFEEVKKLSAILMKKKYPDKQADSWREDAGFSRILTFQQFPGEVIISGQIAEGAAGRAGSGTQIIARMPINTVFRTGYSGRRYGSPMAHYYIFKGDTILSATWEEREVSDIF